MNKKIIVSLSIGLILILGVVGVNYALTLGRETAAIEAVDAMEEVLGDLSNQEQIDIARETLEEATELVESLRDGQVQEELFTRLASIEDIIHEAQEAYDFTMARLAAEEAATTAVNQVEELLEELATQDQIDAAEENYLVAYSLVDDLHDGSVKDNLTEQLEEIRMVIDEAQEQLDAEVAATEKVEAAVELAKELINGIPKQADINTSRNAFKTAETVVNKLHEGTVQEELTEQLAELKGIIDEAQEKRDAEDRRIAEEAATSAVEKAESRINNLENQSAVNSAKSAYDAARPLVNNLHSGSVKNSLSSTINTVKHAIDKAQSELNALRARWTFNISGQFYTYNNFVRDVGLVAGWDPDLISTSVVGKSVEGRDIWSITLGHGSKKVLITGTLHPNEWLNTPILMRTIETLIWDYHQGTVVNGESVRDILNKYTITFMPMVNPDGVILVQQGADAYPDRKEELLAMNEFGEDFSRWKANIRGVDINRNFDVQWNNQPSSGTVSEPAYRFYYGPGPESEPETQAVANWMRNNNPELFLDYHSMGEILYWYYLQTGSQLERDRTIVRAMQNYTRFRMEAVNPRTVPAATSAYWASRVMGIPAVTVENGHISTHLLRMSHLPGMFNKVRYAPLIAIMNLPGY